MRDGENNENKKGRWGGGKWSEHYPLGSWGKKEDPLLKMEEIEVKKW